MSATEKFFSSFELLELALSFLPMEDLLQAQSINRSFRDLISRSRALQKLLYFVGDDTLQTSSDRQINPLLARVFPAWFTTVARDVASQPRQDAVRGTGSSTRSRITFRDVKCPGADSNLEVLHRKHASWRRMLIAQPPIRHILLHRKVGAWVRREDMIRYVFPQGDGLRMAGVVIYPRPHHDCGPCQTEADETHPEDSWSKVGPCDAMIFLHNIYGCVVQFDRDKVELMQKIKAVPNNERDETCDLIMQAMEEKLKSSEGAKEGRVQATRTPVLPSNQPGNAQGPASGNET